jgi:hypothetical protein
MPLSEHKPGANINLDSAQFPTIRCWYFSYYVTPKHKPTTSSGAQLKKQWYVLTLQEKLATLSLLKGTSVSNVACKYGHNITHIHITGCIQKPYFMGDLRDFQGQFWWCDFGFTFHIQNVTPTHDVIPSYLLHFHWNGKVTGHRCRLWTWHLSGAASGWEWLWVGVGFHMSG